MQQLVDEISVSGSNTSSHSIRANFPNLPSIVISRAITTLFAAAKRYTEAHPFKHPFYKFMKETAHNTDKILVEIERHKSDFSSFLSSGEWNGKYLRYLSTLRNEVRNAFTSTLWHEGNPDITDSKRAKLYGDMYGTLCALDYALSHFLELQGDVWHPTVEDNSSLSNEENQRLRLQRIATFLRITDNPPKKHIIGLNPDTSSGFSEIPQRDGGGMERSFLEGRGQGVKGTYEKLSQTIEEIIEDFDRGSDVTQALMELRGDVEKSLEKQSSLPLNHSQEAASVYAQLLGVHGLINLALPLHSRSYGQQLYVPQLSLPRRVL